MPWSLPAVFLKKKNQTTKWSIFSLDRFTDPVCCMVSCSERVVFEQGWELLVLMFLQRQRYAEPERWGQQLRGTGFATSPFCRSPLAHALWLDCHITSLVKQWAEDRWCYGWELLNRVSRESSTLLHIVPTLGY